MNTLDVQSIQIVLARQLLQRANKRRAVRLAPHRRREELAACPAADREDGFYALQIPRTRIINVCTSSGFSEEESTYMLVRCLDEEREVRLVAVSAKGDIRRIFAWHTFIDKSAHRSFVMKMGKRKTHAKE